MASHRLREVKTDDFTVQGYSVAGEETVIAVPELDICFDIGKAPEQLISISNVLLSHGHIDHASGLAYYLSHRLFCGQKPGRVFMPAAIVEPVSRILDAWGQLDGSRIQADIVPVKGGDEFQIRRGLTVKVFDTNHNWNSVGYTIVETRKKLKPEYFGTKGSELARLKKEGVEIEYILEVPLITYTGDTYGIDYSHLDHVKNSKILVIECTFFEQEHIDRAKAGKHIHINCLQEVLAPLNNEKIILIHISQRTSIKYAKNLLAKTLSKELMEKIVVLMDYTRR